MLEFRGYEGANPGLALIRDGNGTRSFETLMRYRSAAMAEFMRALRTLKSLQAEQAATELPAAARLSMRAQPSRPAARPADAHLPAPNEPERRPEPAPERRLEYVLPVSTAPGRTLHEPAAPWLSNRNATGPRHVADDIGARRPNEAEAAQNRSERGMMPAPLGPAIVEAALRAGVSPEAPEPGAGHNR